MASTRQRPRPSLKGAYFFDAPGRRTETRETIGWLTRVWRMRYRLFRASRLPKPTSSRSPRNWRCEPSPEWKW